MDNYLFKDSPYLEAMVYKKGMKEDIICHSQKKKTGIMYTKPHHHSYIELIYCLKGSFSIRVKDIIYITCKHDLIVIPSGDIHSIISNNENEEGEYIVIRVEPRIIFNATKDFNEINKFLSITKRSDHHKLLFKEEELNNSGLPALIKKTYSEYKKRDYGYDLEIHVYICKIFLWILKYWNKDNSKSYSLSYEKKALELTPALTYIQKNYKYDIKAEDMAKLCNLSYSYFSRIFKALFNKNFSDYVNELRISEAEKLLMTTDMTITEIGYEVGFSSSSYFISQFKKIKNISPKKYKSQISL